MFASSPFRTYAAATPYQGSAPPSPGVYAIKAKLMPFGGVFAMMAAFCRALLVASAVIYAFNGIAIYAGIYPWVGKIDPNDIYIYKISGQILWAIIFALIGERVSIAGVEGMPRKATMLACAFCSVSGLATALILMSDRGRSVTV